MRRARVAQKKNAGGNASVFELSKRTSGGLFRIFDARNDVQSSANQVAAMQRFEN